MICIAKCCMVFDGNHQKMDGSTAMLMGIYGWPWSLPERVYHGHDRAHDLGPRWSEVVNLPDYIRFSMTIMHAQNQYLIPTLPIKHMILLETAHPSRVVNLEHNFRDYTIVHHRNSYLPPSKNRKHQDLKLTLMHLLLSFLNIGESLLEIAPASKFF